MSALAFSGCTASTPETATPSAVSPTVLVPTASPTPSAAPAPASAVQAFDGDCSAVLSDDQVRELLGEVRPEPAIVGEDYAPNEVLGSLECQWMGSDTSLLVSAIPAGALPEADAARYAVPECESAYVCEVAAESNGIWLLVGEGSTGEVGIPDEDRATATPALELIRASALSASTPRMAERGADWWTLPSCQQLDQGIDMSALLGVQSTEQVYYSDAYPQGAVWDALIANNLDLWCPWREIDGDPDNILSRGGAIEVQLWPGAADTAAMMETMTRDDMAPVSVKGADAAVSGPLYGDTTSVYAVDGPNVIWVYGTQGVDTLATVASAFLAELD